MPRLPARALLRGAIWACDRRLRNEHVRYLVRKVLLIASRYGDVAEEALGHAFPPHEVLLGAELSNKSLDDLSLEGSQRGRQANATCLSQRA